MSVLINLIGQKFGKLTVIERDSLYKKIVRWICRCDCGNTKTVRGYCLKDGSTLSCGCLGAKRNVGKRRPEQAKTHIGKKFNRLTVTGIERVSDKGGYLMITKCDCGNNSKNVYADLVNGKVKSCGCFIKEQSSINGSLYGLNNCTKQCSKRKWGIEKSDEFIRMRSGFEVMYAMILEKENIDWKYEPKRFKLSEGLRYTPDFFLPEYNFWIDVKGRLTEKAKNKHKLFKNLGYDFKLVFLKEIENRLGISYYKFKKQWDREALKK